MAKRAVALHLVEKGIYVQNLKAVRGSPGEWFSGNWWVSDKTATELVGKKLFLHPGQLEGAHLGGEVISFQKFNGDPKRKIFRFRELSSCIGVKTPKAGWANEKKIVWAP